MASIGRWRIALVLICLPLHGQQVGRIVGEAHSLGVRPPIGAHVPGIRERNDVVDLDRLANTGAALEGNGGVGVRIAQGAGGHRIRTPLDRHICLVDQIPVEDVVAGVAPVVPSRRVIAIVPGVTECGPAVVVAVDPFG